MRRVVTAREQVEMLAPWRLATPWHSKPGDPTYSVPTSDLLRHRQFNPAITTPEQMQRSLWTQSYDPGKEPYRNFATPWSSGGSSEGSSEDDLVDAFEKGHKLPPVEITTNGVGATLSDGNHRTEVADMLGHPDLESYIHYDPHQYQDDFHAGEVDPNTELGRQIHKLVQNHPYEPVDGGPTTDHVFRRHPETGEWQRGTVDHSTPPHFVDTPDYARQMQQHVPGFKNQGLGTYFNVDFGNGPEITHERHLHANLRTAANDWDIRHSAGRDSGVYSAHDPVTGEKAAHLMYRTYTDDDGTPTFLLNGIHTDPAYQRQGLATALLQRLHDDHPDHRVDPGPRSDEGDAWWQHLRTNQPGFSDWTKNSPKSLRDNLRGVLGPPQPIGGGRLASDYRMQHQAPSADYGYPMHDITALLPEDMYHNLHYWPGSDSPGAQETHQLLNQVRGNPEHPVDIYRALPHGRTDFNTGDWVTPSLEYARQHAMHDTDPSQDWPVIKTRVPAKHLWGSGDMLQEMGYHGPSHAGTVT